jgi:hypothetical protein
LDFGFSGPVFAFDHRRSPSSSSSARTANFASLFSQSPLSSPNYFFASISRALATSSTTVLACFLLCTLSFSKQKVCKKREGKKNVEEQEQEEENCFW